MPRNYQLKKNNDDLLPHDLYMRVQYIIKGYDRLKREYMDLLYASPLPPNGMPKGNQAGSPTEAKAIKLEQLSLELRAIDQTCIEMIGLYSGRVQEPFDAVKAYWNYNYFNYSHIRKNIDDIGPSRRTWNRYKLLFSQKVAQKINLF